VNNKIELSKLGQNKGSNHSLKLAIKDTLTFANTIEKTTFTNRTDIIVVKNGFVYFHTYEYRKLKETNTIEGRINIDSFGNIEYSINCEPCTKYLFKLFVKMTKLECKFRFEYVYPYSKTNTFIFLGK